MNYTTQMDAAKKHIITEEMKIVAKKKIECGTINEFSC